MDAILITLAPNSLGLGTYTIQDEAKLLALSRCTRLRPLGCALGARLLRTLGMGLCPLSLRRSRLEFLLHVTILGGCRRLGLPGRSAICEKNFGPCLGLWPRGLKAIHLPLLGLGVLQLHHPRLGPPGAFVLHARSGAIVCFELACDLLVKGWGLGFRSGASYSGTLTSSSGT